MVSSAALQKRQAAVAQRFHSEFFSAGTLPSQQRAATQAEVEILGNFEITGMDLFDAEPSSSDLQNRFSQPLESSLPEQVEEFAESREWYAGVLERAGGNFEARI